MDQKMITLLISIALLCAATAMPTNQLTDCCTEVSNNIKRNLLRHVMCFENQNTQSCNIRAVILHVSSGKLCADPSNRQLKNWILRRKIKKQC